MTALVVDAGSQSSETRDSSEVDWVAASLALSIIIMIMIIILIKRDKNKRK